MSESACKPVGLPPASSLVSSQPLIASTPNDISSTSISLPSLNTFQRPIKNEIQQIPSQPSPRDNMNCFSSPMPVSPHPSPANSLASPMPPPAPSPLQHQFPQADPRQNTNGNIPQSSPGSQSGISAPSTPIQRPPQSPSMHIPVSDGPGPMQHGGVPPAPHHYAQGHPPQINQYQQPNYISTPMNDVGPRVVTQTKLAPAPRRRNQGQQNQRTVPQMQTITREFRQPERPMQIVNGPLIRQNVSTQPVSNSNDSSYRGNMNVYQGPSNPQAIGTMMPPPHPTQSQSPNVMQQTTSGQPMNSLRGPSPHQQGLPVQLSRMGGATRSMHPRVLLQAPQQQSQQQQPIPPPLSQSQSQSLPPNQVSNQQNMMTQQTSNFPSPSKPMGQMVRGQPIPQQITTMAGVTMRPVAQNLPPQQIQQSTAPHMVAGPSQPIATPTPRTQATAALFNGDDAVRLTPKEQYRTLKRKFKFLVYENECYQDQLRNLQRKLLKLSRDKNFLLDRLMQYERLSSSSDDASDSSLHTQVDERPKPKKKARPNRRRAVVGPIPSTSTSMVPIPSGNPGPSGTQMIPSGNSGPTLGAVLTGKRQPSHVVGQLLAQPVNPGLNQPSSSRVDLNETSTPSSTMSAQPPNQHVIQPTTRPTAPQNVPVEPTSSNSTHILMERPVVKQESLPVVSEANPQSIGEVIRESFEANQQKPVLTPVPGTEMKIVDAKSDEIIDDHKSLLNGQNNPSPNFSIEEVENNLKEAEKNGVADEIKKEEEQ